MFIQDHNIGVPSIGQYAARVQLDARQFAHTASAIRVSSAKVEKKHLLGQETHAKKRRGRALSCTTLHKRTYSKFVVRAHTKQHQIAKAASLPSRSAVLMFRSRMGSSNISNMRRLGQTGAKITNKFAKKNFGKVGFLHLQAITHTHIKARCMTHTVELF